MDTHLCTAFERFGYRGPPLATASDLQHDPVCLHSTAPALFPPHTQIQSEAGEGKRVRLPRLRGQWRKEDRGIAVCRVTSES